MTIPDAPPVEADTLDAALARGRRGLEWAGIASRIASAILMLITFSVVPMPNLSRQWPAPLWQFALLLSSPLVLTSLVALAALRRAGHPGYRRWSTVITAADTMTILGVTWLVSHDPDVPVWPLLLIPSLIGGFRHRLVGALLAWTATTTSALVLYGLSVPLLGPSD